VASSGRPAPILAWRFSDRGAGNPALRARVHPRQTVARGAGMAPGAHEVSRFCDLQVTGPGHSARQQQIPPMQGREPSGSGTGPEGCAGSAMRRIKGRTSVVELVLDGRRTRGSPRLCRCSRSTTPGEQNRPYGWHRRETFGMHGSPHRLARNQDRRDPVAFGPRTSHHAVCRRSAIHPGGAGGPGWPGGIPRRLGR
jgi:hypothetical protein